MSGPHLAPLPEFVRHSPHATSVINAWTQSCETTGTLEQRPFRCSSSCAFPFFFFSFPLTVPPSFPCQLPPNSELLLCWKDTFPDVITKSKCCSANRCCERPNMWIQWNKWTSWSWENTSRAFHLSFNQWSHLSLSLCLTALLKFWVVTVRNYLVDETYWWAARDRKEQTLATAMVEISAFKQPVSCV